MTSQKAKKIITRSVGILAALLVLLMIAVGVSAFVCSRNIKVTQYDVTLNGLQNPARLVMVSDIHGKVYGEDSEAEKSVEPEPPASNEPAPEQPDTPAKENDDD